MKIDGLITEALRDAIAYCALMSGPDTATPSAVSSMWRARAVGYQRLLAKLKPRKPAAKPQRLEA